MRPLAVGFVLAFCLSMTGCCWCHHHRHCWYYDPASPERAGGPVPAEVPAR